MNRTSTEIAKHLREVFFGGNWTWSNLKEQLSDVSWEEALEQRYGLNNIATLTYHIGYFVDVQVKVLKGGPLVGKDSESFTHPAIESVADWTSMKESILNAAESLASEVEQLDDQQLWEDFTDTKYGIYYRNLSGLIEHSHYHLGQISWMKKILRSS